MYVEICISLKAPGGLPINRLEVKYRFFDRSNINKMSRIIKKKFLKNFFCHGIDLFCNKPKTGKKPMTLILWVLFL